MYDINAGHDHLVQAARCALETPQETAQRPQIRVVQGPCIVQGHQRGVKFVDQDHRRGFGSLVQGHNQSAQQTTGTFRTCRFPVKPRGRHPCRLAPRTPEARLRQNHARQLCRQLVTVARFEVAHVQPDHRMPIVVLGIALAPGSTGKQHVVPHLRLTGYRQVSLVHALHGRQHETLAKPTGTAQKEIVRRVGEQASNLGRLVHVGLALTPQMREFRSPSRQPGQPPAARARVLPELAHNLFTLPDPRPCRRLL